MASSFTEIDFYQFELFLEKNLLKDKSIETFQVA